MNQKAKGIIGILTGGGDVPGLNPAIRAGLEGFGRCHPGQKSR